MITERLIIGDTDSGHIQIAVGVHGDITLLIESDGLRLHPGELPPGRSWLSLTPLEAIEVAEKLLAAGRGLLVEARRREDADEWERAAQARLAKTLSETD